MGKDEERCSETGRNGKWEGKRRKRNVLYIKENNFFSSFSCHFSGIFHMSI